MSQDQKQKEKAVKDYQKQRTLLRLQTAITHLKQNEQKTS